MSKQHRIRKKRIRNRAALKRKTIAERAAKKLRAVGTPRKSA